MEWAFGAEGGRVGCCQLRNSLEHELLLECRAPPGATTVSAHKEAWGGERRRSREGTSGHAR